MLILLVLPYSFAKSAFNQDRGKSEKDDLTPSGLTTLVTVTDWKNDLVRGWFGA